MRIYGFTGHPEVLQNAAPVMSVQPTLFGLPASDVEALNNVQLSGPQRDTFVRNHTAATPSPKAFTMMSPDRALWQMNTMTVPSFRAQMAYKMASGTAQDLADVSSWLSAAQQHNKIQYAKREDAELNFGRHLREGKEALFAGDIPFSAMSLNRARRCVDDFQNLRSAITKTERPEGNPFKLL